MSESRRPQNIAEANAEIERLRARITDLESAAAADSGQADPIAIVGMGCRFPGEVDTPEAFWDLLASGRDVLGDIPPSRWDIDAYYDPAVPAPGKMYVRQGHYLDDIDQFDPHFFGLSPREARSLDPQQRLILEVTWETLEHAGIAASSLKGGKTGVFVGQYWDDYSMQRIFATDIRQVDRYAQLSGLRGLTAGRICHILDSHGPAMQVDTACSSSSLAVHLACQSLRGGESDLALAGGVSLILAPEHLVGVCQMQALSPSGRCKTFDADADGFGQGEGAGMIALKRLRDARAHGDRILAVIHGSCANHDGHARTVTTPSGPAQRAMLEDAVRNSGLHPHQIGYVETHGTGTPLGDPIEVLAIARVLCESRETPLYLGSVKTNVGHLDAAAGIVGLMKVVLSLQHGMIPPHLNFATPNPRIPWNDWPLRVPTEPVPWPSQQKIAGISAFGMSGTNVHLVVGEAPAAPAKPTMPQAAFPVHLLTLSAQSEAALPAVAHRYAEFLAQFPAPPEANELACVCCSAATGRTHFTYRAAVVAESAAEMQRQLTDLASGTVPRDVTIGATGRRAPALAFLFTGQGAQHVGMGRAIYDIHPTFRFWLDRCAQILDDQLDKPLLEVLWSGEDLHQTAYTQPGLFAVEYALARLWREWGVEPDVLLGHSIGEYTAACVADVFSLEDGLKLVAARGRLMQSLPTGGAMASVAADEAIVARHLQGLEGVISIGAQNGPRSIVISGQGDAVQSVTQVLDDAGIKTTRLKVSHAFHSPLMEPILSAFREVAAQVTYRPPTRPVLSNVTGEELGEHSIDPDYWVEHLRGAVRFADGVATIQDRKIETFVEIGPRPTLLGLGRGCVPGSYGTWLPSLRPKSEWKTMLDSLAALHVRGVDVDWAAFHGEGHEKTVLPNYPWQRQRYWIDASPVAPAGPALHPLVHRKLQTASDQSIFESNLSVTEPAYLADHLVFGNAVFPASALLEMGAAAGRLAGGDDAAVLADVTLQSALLLSETPVTVQVIVTPNEQENRFEIFSRAAEAGPPGPEGWTCHATGALRGPTEITGAADTPFDPKTLSARDTTLIDLQLIEQRFANRGVTYGPAFSAISQAGFSGSGSVIARLELPPIAEGEFDAYGIHPVLLDAGLRMAEVLFPDGDPQSIFLPFSVGSLHARQAPPGPLWVRATGTEHAAVRSVDLEIFDTKGKRVAAVNKFTLRPVSVFGLRRQTARTSTSEEQLGRWLHQVRWTQVSDPEPHVPQLPSGAWLVVGDQTGHAHRLVQALEERGASCLLAGYSASSERPGSDSLEPAGAFAGPALARLLAGRISEPLAGVIYLGALDANEATYVDGLASALHLVQALGDDERSVPLWLVTRAAQAVIPGDSAGLAIWQSPLWGFGRTVQVEHPELRCTCVDLEADDYDLASLLDALTQTDGEQQIAYRSGHRYLARLGRSNLKPAAKAVFKLDREATYLVTGGLGALGLEVARFLVWSGARRLLLTGRRGASTKAQREAIGILEKLDATIEVIPADITIPEDVARILEAGGPTLRGIIHAAGVLDDGMLTQQTSDRFRLVAGPKVNGAWHLHQQTLDHRLDFFVLFSSVSSIVGSAGQSNYAAANAFMDGLAHWRRQQGLPALAINWGPWADVGMASTETVLRRLMNDGWQPMTSAQACHAMARLMGQAELAQAGVIPLDWSAFARSVPGAEQWPLLADLLAEANASGEGTASAAKAIATQALAASPQERPKLLTSYLKERVAQTLRVSIAAVDEREPLSNLGMDSLTAVELRTWIQLDLDTELTVEQMFTTPTVGELAVVLSAEFGGEAGLSSEQLRADTSTTSEPKTSAGWVLRPHPNPDARLRLFCFPFAGGGASMYREWSDSMPVDIELCLLQLPGREERLQEPPLDEMSTLVEAITQALTPFADKPFAFFGHSMGAMIAFEVARNLRDKGAPEPIHLFLSARQAPQLGRAGEPLRFLPDRDFVEKLHGLYGAVPEAILENSRLQEIFLPVLRADVALLETHEFVASAPLECPITVFGGEQDPHISPEMLSPWRDQTQAGFSQRCFDGDHFYIVPAKAAVTAAIASTLAQGD